jgi:hypothetical protein
MIVVFKFSNSHNVLLLLKDSAPLLLAAHFADRHRQINKRRGKTMKTCEAQDREDAIAAQRLHSREQIRTNIGFGYTKSERNQKKLKSGEQNGGKQKLLESDMVPPKWPNFNSQNRYNLATTRKSLIYLFSENINSVSSCI